MTLRVPKIAFAMTLLFVVVATITFIWLMGRFGGPSVSVGGPVYHVSFHVPDTQGLATKSDVLTRGVKVGEVSAINVGDATADVEISLDERHEPVRLGDRVRIGQKTLLGEAYVDLQRSARPGAAIADRGRLPGAAAVESVELDEALAAVGPESRPAIRSMLKTFDRGARDAQTPQRLNATVRRLDAVTGELATLTDSLRGQERTIAGLVTDARSVFGLLGERRDQITTIVDAGGETLAALAAHRDGLSAGLAQLPVTVSVADSALTVLEPLLREAQPLLRDLRRAAPALTPALRDLRPVSRDATGVLRRLGTLQREASPVLKLARPVVAAARPVAVKLSPVLANIVPIMGYLDSRRDTLAAWFSQTNAFSQQGDAKGKFVRFGIFVEPNTAFGGQGTFENNAYPPPGDQGRNAPYAPGSYPRLQPYAP